MGILKSFAVVAVGIPAAIMALYYICYFVMSAFGLVGAWPLLG